jgi:lysozyme
MKDALAMCKCFEGLCLVPYLCPANVWTIGYGTTHYPNGKRVAKDDPACTVEQAEHWLEYELSYARHQVRKLVQVELTVNQEEALVDFVYNLGAGAFRASTLLKRVNSGDFADVPYQLSRWVNGGGRKLPGLVKRRAAEAELFTNPVS